MERGLGIEIIDREVPRTKVDMVGCERLSIAARSAIIWNRLILILLYVERNSHSTHCKLITKLRSDLRGITMRRTPLTTRSTILRGLNIAIVL